MATVPAPRTWAVGELLTAAKLNTDLRDGMSFLLATPFTMLQKTGNQTLTNSAWTPVDWDSEQFDDDAGHDNVTNPSRYTIKTAGWWELTSTIRTEVSTAGRRGGRFRKNATGNPLPGEVVASPDTAGLSVLSFTTTVLLAVNDYVQVEAWQDSGTSRTITPALDSSPAFFSCHWVRS